MIETIARLGRPALAVTALVLALAVPAAAQYPAPLAEPPSTPQFMPRYDFRLSAAYLRTDDPTNFMWDTHWGGDLDLVDYVKGRAGVLIDYQAVLGDEYRPFDPNQGNYTLEASGSYRLGETEVVGVFHHVSRHLSDRPKRFAIAMNVLELRVLRRFDFDGTTVDVKVEGGPLIQRSFVDYNWIGSADVTVRQRVNAGVSPYGRVAGQLYGTDREIANRGMQRGGRFEAGVRLRGSGGAIDLFAGYERVVDAGPADRLARRWPFAGFRLVR
jgi:hypothetical protein